MRIYIPITAFLETKVPGIDVAFEDFIQRHGRSYVKDTQVPRGIHHKGAWTWGYLEDHPIVSGS